MGLDMQPKFVESNLSWLVMLLVFGGLVYAVATNLDSFELPKNQATDLNAVVNGCTGSTTTTKQIGQSNELVTVCEGENGTNK
jgi:hypothetical protein